jgi:hypothetical protein
MDTFFATDLNKFAEEVVWFMPAEEALNDMNYFLVHLMAKSPIQAYAHFREYFPQYTDDDFINALKNASPGIFLYENLWNRWNEKFGLVPPLPFPRKYPNSSMS